MLQVSGWKQNPQNNKADRPANSRERWARALMEVRSLFSLNYAVKKSGMDGPRTVGRTDGRTDGRTERIT